MNQDFDTNWWKLLEAWRHQAGPSKVETHPCFCIGPQNGEPLCPCRMRSVKIVDGRYVQVIDYGPAPKKDPTQ